MSQEKELTHQAIEGLGSETYTINKNKRDYYLKERISNRTVSLLAMPDIGKIFTIIR